MKHTKILTRIFLVTTIFINVVHAIRNGQDASISEFPWQVSIRDRTGHICGGAILSEILVVTAAHCVHDKNLPWIDKSLYVLSGTNDRENNNPQYIHKVQSKHLHERFDWSQNDNDIAMLKMETPFSFSSQRQFINLPSSTKIPVGSSVNIAGWGQTRNDDRTLPKYLKKLETLYYGTTSNNKFKKKFNSFEIEYNRLYTYEDSESGVSNGDSGGAVSYGNTLIGIVERYIPLKYLDENLKYASYPDIHVNVVEYIPWIQKIKNKYSYNENSIPRT